MTQSRTSAVPKTGASRWTAPVITALVLGSLLCLFSLLLLGISGAAFWADRTQRDAGYATTDVHSFTTQGSALTTKPTDLGSGGFGWLYSPDVLGKVRIRVTPTSSAPVFAGIARSSDVENYLAGVSHTVITEFRDDGTELVAGGRAPAAPAGQSFWVASASGSGRQTLDWKPKAGSWSVVVMNTDARPGVAVDADLGAKVPALPWIALGFLVAGLIFAAGGALLLIGGLRQNRTTT